jgi:hypothetical protein
MELELRNDWADHFEVKFQGSSQLLVVQMFQLVVTTWQAHRGYYIVSSDRYAELWLPFSKKKNTR